MTFKEKNDNLYNKKVSAIEKVNTKINEKRLQGMSYEDIEKDTEYNRALDELFFHERAFNNFPRFKGTRGDDEQMDRDYNPMDF